MASLPSHKAVLSRRSGESASPDSPRRSRRPLARLALGAASALSLGALAQACSFDWASYDPRLGAEAQSASSSSGSGPGSGGGGGMSSTSSSAGQGGSGGMSAASSGAGQGGSGGMSASSSSVAGTGGSGTGGSGTGGSGGGGGGGPTGPCGGFSLLTDNFQDGVEGTRWYWSGDPGTTIAEPGGETVITMPSNPGSSRYAAIQSKRLYDLRNDSISVDIKQVTNTATTAQTFINVVYDGQNYIQIYERMGQLVSTSVVNDNVSTLGTVAYSAVNHRYWRIREDGTKTYWETSPDNVIWSIRAESLTASLFSLAAVRVDIGAYLEGDEVNPGSAHFDNVNGGGPSSAKWCPMDTFTDDFNDGVEGREWGRSYQGPGCLHMETGGQFVVKPPSSMIDYCARVSSSSYDLTNSSFIIKVPTMVNTSTTAETFVRLESEGDGWLEMGQSNGFIEFRKEVQGAESILATIAYKPAMHVWWRFRVQGSTAYWETSPDGVVWTINAQESPPPIPVTGLDVIVGGGTFEPVASPGEAHFDNMNLPP